MRTRCLSLVCLFLLTVVCPWRGSAQDRVVTFATILDGDTIPLVKLKEINITASASLLSPSEIRKNQKLIRNVKKMLPYAKLARTELDKLEREAAQLPPAKRRKLIKATEKEMLDQYTEDLKKFTFSQGLVLLKLVDRETSRTSYTIVNELRGKLRATFYQTFARLFGYNLKEEYDPAHNKQDNLIERICLMVESGKL